MMGLKSAYLFRYDYVELCTVLFNYVKHFLKRGVWDYFRNCEIIKGGWLSSKGFCLYETFFLFQQSILK